MPYIAIPARLHNRKYLYYYVVDDDCLGRSCFEELFIKTRRNFLTNTPSQFIRICKTYYERRTNHIKPHCPEDMKVVDIILRDARERKGWCIKYI